MNIFIASTPLVMLNILEAREHWDLKPAESILLCTTCPLENPRRFFQTGRMIDANDWADVQLLPAERSSALEGITNLRKVKKIAQKWQPCRRVFLADPYRPELALLAKRLEPQELIFIDDGVMSLQIVKDREKKLSWNNRGGYTRKQFLLAKAITKAEISQLPPFSFFTAYEALNTSKQDTKVINAYPRVKKKLHALEKRKETYFFGQPLSNQGYLRMHDEALLDTIEKISQEEEAEGNAFFYVPHPGEKKELFTQLKKRGITIQFLPMLPEAYFVIEGFLPKKIMSFFSSMLKTCFLIYGPDLKIIAYDILKHLFCEDEQNFKRLTKVVQQYYDDLQALGEENLERRIL